MVNNPSGGETLTTGDSLIDHTCKELGITSKSVNETMTLKDKLAKLGITPNITQVDGYQYLNDLWPGDEKKLSVLEWIWPYFPQEFRNQTQKVGPLVSPLSLEDSEAEKASKVFTVMLGGGVGWELHCESDQGAVNNGHWDVINNLFERVTQEPAGGRGEKIFPVKTAHLPFLYLRENLADFQDKVLELTDNRILASRREPLSRLNHDEIEHAFSDLEKLQRLGVQVETYYLSGYFDREVLNGIGDQKVQQTIRDISEIYTFYLYLNQIETMSDRYGVEKFTFHAGPLAGSLDDQEFNRLKDNLERLGSRLAQLNLNEGKSVKLLTETQSLTKRQWEELFDSQQLTEYWGTTLGVNLDTVHLAAERSVHKSLTDVQVQNTWQTTQSNFGERADINFWLDKHWDLVNEVHISASPPTEMEWLMHHANVRDDHLGISEGEAPYLREVLRAVSQHNLQIKNSGVGEPKVVTHEATTLPSDFELMINVLDTED